MSGKNSGAARSILDRLKNRARDAAVEPQALLVRYGHERFLYRLSRSPHADRFVLKGAMLLVAWFGETLRPTRDIDLLGFGDVSVEELSRLFRAICAVDVEFDGMEYDAESLRVEEIRNEDAYGGKRATLNARLGASRMVIQVDIGVGDAVQPAAEWIDYPGLLDLPTPRLRAYRKETVIAEKLHAMILLGEINSRMKDFFDVHMLASRESFDEATLRRAVVATFERRRTPIPSEVPAALSPAFPAAPERQAQWSAFLRRSGLASAPRRVEDVLPLVVTFLLPLIEGSRAADSPAGRTWRPGGPWSSV